MLPFFCRADVPTAYGCRPLLEQEAPEAVARSSPNSMPTAATLGASFGFVLPFSTPQNAIVHGPGAVPLLATVRIGFGLHITGTLTLISPIAPLTALTGIGG